MSAPDNPRDTLREQLSALMDGELSRAESLFLLKRLEHDEELRTEWERLHVASALQQGEMQVVSAGFSARIMTAIAEEAVPVASPARAIAGGRGMPRWLGTVAGGAVAAAVAYVALVNLGPQSAVPAAPVPGATLVAAGAGNPAEPRPGSAATGTMNLPAQIFAPVAAQTNGGARLSGLDAANLRLDRYLLRHSEALGRPSAGMPQLLSPGLYPVQFGDAGNRVVAQPAQ